MNKRVVIAVQMTTGLAWAGALLTWAIGPRAVLDGLSLAEGLARAAFIAGLPLLVMIGRLAQRRFFDDGLIDGQRYAPGSAADIDQKVLTNTVEQLVLAAAIWPLVAVLAHPGAPVWLAAGFAVTRLLFWVGYHLWAPLRGVGFAAGFYPTVLAALWCLAALLR